MWRRAWRAERGQTGGRNGGVRRTGRRSYTWMRMSVVGAERVSGSSMAVDEADGLRERAQVGGRAICRLGSGGKKVAQALIMIQYRWRLLPACNKLASASWVRGTSEKTSTSTRLDSIFPCKSGSQSHGQCQRVACSVESQLSDNHTARNSRRAKVPRVKRSLKTDDVAPIPT